MYLVGLILLALQHKLKANPVQQLGFKVQELQKVKHNPKELLTLLQIGPGIHSLDCRILLILQVCPSYRDEHAKLVLEGVISPQPITLDDVDQRELDIGVGDLFPLEIASLL